MTEELPEIFGMIGSAALPRLKVAIADIATDEIVCIDAITCVEKIGIRWTEARSACVALLMEQLDLFEINDPEAKRFSCFGTGSTASEGSSSYDRTGVCFQVR